MGDDVRHHSRRRDLRHARPAARRSAKCSARFRVDHPRRRHWQSRDSDATRSTGSPNCCKGNVDNGEWAAILPDTALAKAGSTNIYVLHDVNQLALNPIAAGFQIVVSGHSHKPATLERSGVLYLNPGSAGPRRFKLPVTIARLLLQGSAWEVGFVDLLTGKDHFPSDVEA